MVRRWLILVLVSVAMTAVVAQSCQNSGYQNGSACACPSGFGGVNCTQPACGGNIFQGSTRPLVPSSSSLPNITAANCACQTGWNGTSCNVCQSASACQNAFSAAGGTTPAADPSSLGGGTQNDTMVCSTKPEVYAAGQLSCQVIVRDLFSLSGLQKNIPSSVQSPESNRSERLYGIYHVQHSPHSQSFSHSSPKRHRFRSSQFHVRPTLVRRRRAILLPSLDLPTESERRQRSERDLELPQPQMQLHTRHHLLRS